MRRNMMLRPVAVAQATGCCSGYPQKFFLNHVKVGSSSTVLLRRHRCGGGNFHPASNAITRSLWMGRTTTTAASGNGRKEAFHDDVSPTRSCIGSGGGRKKHTTTTTTKTTTRPTVQTTAPSFRATKVFFTGEIEYLNVKSTELLQTSKIHARDLFELNLTSRQERRTYYKRHARGGGSGQTPPVRRALAAILPRKTSIVLSFAQIRAVVGRHYVLFLEAHDPAVQDFANELANTYKQLHNQGKYKHLTRQHTSHDEPTLLSDYKNRQQQQHLQEPGELIFLEEVLRNSIDSFKRRLRLYDPIVNSFLDSVANEVYSDTGVHALVPLKDSLQSFEMHVKQCLDCLTELLEDDEEMLALLLTEQARAAETGRAVDFQRHQHVELLLGVYARQLNNILMEIQFLLQRIQSKQEFVALALAGYRNRGGYTFCLKTPQRVGGFQQQQQQQQQ